MENAFVSHKVESGHFYSYPQAKPSQVFIITPMQMEITHPPRQWFFEILFSPQQKGRKETVN